MARTTASSAPRIVGGITAAPGNALAQLDNLPAVTQLTRHLHFQAVADNGERFALRHGRAAG